MDQDKDNGGNDPSENLISGIYPNEQKRGYLNSDFEYFHLKDMKNIQFEYHYHDFSKIIVFISGNVTYLIEGKAYRLKPWDILFVGSSEIHKPIIDPTVPYDRIAIWVKPGFLENHSWESDLLTCFHLTAERNVNLLRLEPNETKYLQSLLYRLEEAFKTDGFGSGVFKNAIFLQLIVVLTRELLGKSGTKEISDIVTDANIQKILNYINSNIDKDLSVDTLAGRFYLNRYHLMHKFKQQTGFTVHGFVMQKRLLKADNLIRSGTPAANASEMSGFNDYSNFVRAYKKLFGASPKKRSGPSTLQQTAHIDI
ncbi:MAG TPA: AraC family transcriptional regulator [Clostridia bacterium]|nr:AraC family transcriptional regulator [Clostridia bacterium]